MKKITVKQIFKEKEKYIDQEVVINGWVRTLRSSKNFGFIELNDGTFFKSIQVVFADKLKNFDDIAKTTIGSSLVVEGKLIKSPAEGQEFEIQASKIEVVGLADADYPLQKKKHSFEFLRTIAHLRSRSNTFSAVFRVSSKLEYAIHKFFQERDFVYIHSPIITASDCEGAGEMFQITTLDLNKLPKNDKGEVDLKEDFFGKRAGLTVSGQLNAETMAMAFQKVYTFGPTFRAENSNTTRHVAEFWMLEPEMAFADLEDDMHLAEEMIKYLVDYILTECPEEMEFFNKFIEPTLLERLHNLRTAEFKKMTYTEAINILEKADVKFEVPVKWGIDLQTEHERYLTDKVVKGPVFVTDYPKEFKAFYMRLNDDKKTVAAVDLLVPGVGEIIGGSQREERLDVLKARMKECGIKEEDLEWYLDTRRFGGAPHAGFGLGFERALMYLTGMANIRDVIPFPRTPKNVDF
ncbi:MAG: Asparagine--tRNA ligase [Parcubacteria group bacterium ADurb.Bin316]|nr:MAG: Asparagine--tRNA ligase [Parcubacteria group bacterium ADurb.Bin316]HOZ56091.1 asparagine--tRNA ligase [bacterium]